MTDRRTPRSAANVTVLLEERGPGSSARGPAPAETFRAVAVRVRGEYEEMPGLQLTVPQAARLLGCRADVAQAVLDDLSRAAVLVRAVIRPHGHGVRAANARRLDGHESS